jgi:hypothetical protein
MFSSSSSSAFDWPRAIKRNRGALTGIVAALFAMLGLTGDATVGRIPRALHRAVLRVLRPAESALRRLIVIAARGLVLKPVPARPKPSGPITRKGGATRLSFQLFDTRTRFDLRPRRRKRPEPRIHFYWPDPHLMPLNPAAWPPAPPVKPPDDGMVDAGRLRRRLEAIKLALEDLPRQAKRLVRSRARRETMQKQGRAVFTSPMRPGRPPGYRKKPSHEVDEVLIECHGLALDAMRLDTS